MAYTEVASSPRSLKYIHNGLVHERVHLSYLQDDVYGEQDSMMATKDHDAGTGNGERTVVTSFETYPTERWTVFSDSERRQELIKLVRRFVLLFLICLGYMVYVGFAVYLHPEDSFFVCILAPFILYYLLNKLSRGKLRKVLLRTWKKFKKRLTPRHKASIWIRRCSTIVIGLGILVFLAIDIWDAWEKYIPLGGLCVFILLSIFFSKSPRKINWVPVIWGIILQFCLGLLILRWGPGYQACQWTGDQVMKFLGYTDVGSKFVFGEKYMDHAVVFKILPVVVFFSAIVSFLYYVGAMQTIIKAIALVIQVTMGTTPIEAFATASHIFIGQVESSVALRPFWMKLTESEIHAVMTGGFATVAGTIIAAYVEFGVPAEHVISASFMSAPAALAIAKISVPETEVSKIKTQKEIDLPSGKEANAIEALTVGATTAIMLIGYVVVNLIAFIALLAFLDDILSYFGARVDCPELSFQLIFSYLFMPLAMIMGVSWSEAGVVAALIGKKVFVNEFLAYIDLGQMIQEGTISDRAGVLSTYILCGFGSVAALGINMGSLASAAPDRTADFARLMLRSMINGNIACFMTACIAGLLYQDKTNIDLLETLHNSTLSTSAINATNISTISTASVTF